MEKEQMNFPFTIMFHLQKALSRCQGAGVCLPMPASRSSLKVLVSQDLCTWPLWSLRPGEQQWGSLATPWIKKMGEEKGRNQVLGAQIRDGTGGMTLHGERRSNVSTEVCRSTRNHMCSHEFVQSSRWKMPGLFVFTCLQNMFTLLSRIEREKWWIQLIAGKMDVKIRCLCMFSELIFCAKGLKPAILLYYLGDYLPCFMRFFLLPDLYFIDRQINTTLNFPVHLLAASLPDSSSGERSLGPSAFPLICFSPCEWRSTAVQGLEPALGKAQPAHRGSDQKLCCKEKLDY